MPDPKKKPNSARQRNNPPPPRKNRSDSPWNSLTPHQCETVEEWLFEDNLGYAETAERLQKEFGRQTSKSSVARFYRQRARARRSLELLEAQAAAKEMGDIPVKTKDLRATTIKLLAKSALRLAIEKPDELAQVLPLAKVLLESQQNEIRLRKVKLDERYYDFDEAHRPPPTYEDRVRMATNLSTLYQLFFSMIFKDRIKSAQEPQPAQSGEVGAEARAGQAGDSQNRLDQSETNDAADQQNGSENEGPTK